MTPREKAYIFRIAAILETGESVIGAQHLAVELYRINPIWDDRAIAAAVAFIRASILRIPYAQLRFDAAA